MRPLRALAAVLVTLSVLAAGCVGTAAASANDARGAADQAALAWDPGARLSSLLGVEGSLPALMLAEWAGYGSGASTDYAPARDDEAVGDGLAEVWAYRYVAEGKARAFVVVVDRDDNVLRTAEGFKRDEDAPLAAWSLDSDDALAAAKDASADLRDGVGHERFGTLAALRTGAAGPEWIVVGGGFGDTGVAGGLVRLDAATGAVLDVDGASWAHGG